MAVQKVEALQFGSDPPDTAPDIGRQTQVIFSPVEVIKPSKIIASMEYKKGDNNPALSFVLKNPGVVTPSGENVLKVGNLFATQTYPYKREIYITDHESNFAVMSTVQPNAETLDLTYQNIGRPESNDVVLRMKDIFPVENPLTAIVIVNDLSEHEANVRLKNDLTSQGISNVFFIYAGSVSDNMEFRYWNSTFDPATGSLNIYSWLGKGRYEIKIAKDQKTTEKETLYEKYLQYLDIGGNIDWNFMKGAEEKLQFEIFQKHYGNPDLIPKTKYPESDFEKALKNAVHLALEISRRTGIELTAEQQRMFVNLRLMPDDSLTTYNYGWRPPDKNNGARNLITFVTPAQLSDHGLLDHVLKWTGDHSQIYALSKWNARNFPKNETAIPQLNWKQKRQKLLRILKLGNHKNIFIPPKAEVRNIANN